MSDDCNKSAEVNNGTPFAEARGSAVRWTREECLEGMWELYRDYCQMESERNGCSATRLPDYENMLKQLEQHGMPAPPNGKAEAQCPGKKGKNASKPN
jgi:hypothetical protein